MSRIKVGSDFSGVGAFNQALIRLGIDFKEVFACDMDKYARQTFIHNYGEPEYYPENVYNREIPTDPLDIYMTSPPCQAFSLAGKRKGETDKRGVLFYNSHEFIAKNNPRYFIFENVKGLLSDDNGKTFQRWIDMLGGKTVNGNPVIFPHEEAVPYHVYYQVLNAKHYGVPQNRERIFIIGIRDDADNNFSFPKPYPLVKRLKDVLEPEVDEKYFLSDKMVSHLTNHNRAQDYISQETENVNCITANYAKQSSDLQYLKVKSATSQGYEIATENDIIVKPVQLGKSEQFAKTSELIGNNDQEAFCIRATESNGVLIGAIRGLNPENPLSRESGLPTQQMLEINESGCSNALTTVQKDNVVVMGIEKVGQLPGHESTGRIYGTNGISPIITAKQGGGHEPYIETKDNIVVLKFERTEEAKQKRKESVARTGKDIGTFSERKMIGVHQNFSDTILANPNPQKEGVIAITDDVVQLNPSTESGGKQPYQQNRVYADYGVMTCLDTDSGKKSVLNNQRIRRLTPRECFRLMDFPDTFTWPVSDSQAYKQAGNSIVVNCLVEIIKKLNL